MGKGILKYLASAILLFSVSVSAYGYDPLPSQLDGSMMVFDFAACDSTVAWNDSLTPVYVAYVARHGARFMTSPEKLEKLLELIYEAAREKRATSAGTNFASLIRKMLKAGAGNWGQLSPTGNAEEARLGKDMVKMLPNLLKKGDVTAISSYIPRVTMSMYDFMHALSSESSGLDIFTASGKIFSKYLRSFSTDSIYSAFRKDGDWKQVYEEYYRQWVSPEPARRLLGLRNSDDRGKLRDITFLMYDIMSSCRAAGLPAPTTEFMSLEEYRGCWMADNLEHYLRNGVSPLSTACAAANTPLVDKIIAEADSALTSTDETRKVFSGYFGHAETLLPLLSILDIEGCFTIPRDYPDLAETWKVQDITPLGANLAIILLRGESGEIYASLRLNGKNIQPLRNRGMIAKWRELKELWTERIRLLRNQQEP